MSPFLLVAAVLFVLMAKRLADMYLGEEYVWPLLRSEKQSKAFVRLSVAPLSRLSAS
jgi:uncharacterized membrane protein YbaN (DUF454 family)